MNGVPPVMDTVGAQIEWIFDSNRVLVETAVIRKIDTTNAATQMNKGKIEFLQLYGRSGDTLITEVIGIVLRAEDANNSVYYVYRGSDGTLRVTSPSVPDNSVPTATPVPDEAKNSNGIAFVSRSVKSGGVSDSGGAGENGASFGLKLDNASSVNISKEKGNFTTSYDGTYQVGYK